MAKRRRPPGYDGRFKFTSWDGEVLDDDCRTVEDVVDYLSTSGDATDARVVECLYFEPGGRIVHRYAVSSDGEEIAATADDPTWNVHDFLAGTVGRRYVERWSDGRETSAERLE